MVSTTPAPRLTPKVRDLVATDRLNRPPVGHLTPAQVTTITAVAKGEDRFSEPVSVSLALIALAVGARPEVALPVLDEVAADPTADRSDRITAARELGRIATPRAQDRLLRRVRDRDPRVQHAAFAALGKFADPAALRELTKLVEPSDLASRRQLALTRALIAHRHGLDGPFLPELPAATRRLGRPGEMTTLTLARKTATTTAADRAKVIGSTYGIELSDRAYGLACGKARWTLFMNADLGHSVDDLDPVFERAWILGLLARWVPQGVGLATQYLVLSRPLREVVRLDVVRSDGEVLYTGSAQRTEKELGFRVADVDRPGTAPTSLHGTVTGRGLVLTESVAFASRINTRTTADVAARR